MTIRTGIGQDSHRFVSEESSKTGILGGVIFDNAPGMLANSDGDVVLHAICNAISSVTGIRILGTIADELLEKDGITDSSVYLHKAIETLGDKKINHVAITIEAKKPIIGKRLDDMRAKIAEIMDIDITSVGITATSGEGLTACGRGEGIQVFAIITTNQ